MKVADRMSFTDTQLARLKELVPLMPQDLEFTAHIGALIARLEAAERCFQEPGTPVDWNQWREDYNAWRKAAGK